MNGKRTWDNQLCRYLTRYEKRARQKSRHKKKIAAIYAIRNSAQRREKLAARKQSYPMRFWISLGIAKKHSTATSRSE